MYIIEIFFNTISDMLHTTIVVENNRSALYFMLSVLDKSPHVSKIEVYDGVSQVSKRDLNFSGLEKFA